MHFEKEVGIKVVIDEPVFTALLSSLLASVNRILRRLITLLTLQ